MNYRYRKCIRLATFLIISVIFMAGCTSSGPYKRLPDGVMVSLSKKINGVQNVRLQVVNDHIIRVTAFPEDDLKEDTSLMVLRTAFTEPDFDIQQSEDAIILTTAYLRAILNRGSGQLQFYDSSGAPLLHEKINGRTMIPDTIDDHPTYKVRQVFDNLNHSALFGLGGNQLGLTNVRGENIALIQRNSEAFVPLLVSPDRFGILWDNNSITHFGDPTPWLALDSFDLGDVKGVAGSLTATYLHNADQMKAEGPGQWIRSERDIDYSILEDMKRFPEGFKPDQPATVEWQGSIASRYTGLHSFKLYSGGYIKMWINGHLILDRWRQCWNPAETLLKVPMDSGKKYNIKLLWNPDGGESFLSVKWKPPTEEPNEISFAAEMGRTIDYYFIHGANMDSIISGYRHLTGKAPIMPLWAYGYWQSRERYHSQEELLNVVKEFRKRNIPLDNIVQDWFYWKEDQWGSQQFDSSRFPDPGGMIKTLHNDYNTHFMISVWPKFYTGTNAFKSFWDKGWLYKRNIEDSTKDWVGHVSTFYDAFNTEARHAFWNLVKDNLFELGVDAWWLDATEPDILSNISNERRKNLMKPNALGSPSQYFNAYAPEQSRAFYEGQRTTRPDQRVFILTRSAYGGSQRYAAATWSGDIGATWRDMKDQIATGISFSLSGIPYWTMDIGGFATEHRYQFPDAGDLAEWREQTTRWFQFGAFLPIFRAHGQPPFREPFNVAPEGSTAYNSMLYYSRLRYRLLPYIYSVAGEVYLNNYTMMRGLAMDFSSDTTAVNINDQFMFGPSLLINPVYKYGAKNRNVYLPDETIWYNFYSNQRYTGGQTIVADAPYERMPVFVKAGSILPFGPALEYTSQHPADTLTLYIYAGQDGQFNIYEDDGLSYQYEGKAYSVIPIKYDDQRRVLEIGERSGSFKEIRSERIFRIKMIDGSTLGSMNLTNLPYSKLIKYNGGKLWVKIDN